VSSNQGRNHLAGIFFVCVLLTPFAYASESNPQVASEPPTSVPENPPAITYTPSSQVTETTLNQTKSRVFILRETSSVILGGVSVWFEGKKVASLSNKEFDVLEFKTGEVSYEVGQNLSADLCKGKLPVDPLVDNYFLIKDRDVSAARRFFFRSPVISLLERAGGGGDCNGLDELVKISKDEAMQKISGYEYSPHDKRESGAYSPASICSSSGASNCDVTFEMFAKAMPIKYVADASAPGFPKPPELQIQCQVGANPQISVTVDACLKIKGRIIGRESLRCVLAGNPPIALDPELCISGGGSVVQ
jgi:hypothetical protein